MTAKTQSRKADIRQQNERIILIAAKKVFAIYGFKGSSTQRIADEAHLPKANIHYYFGTKTRLYELVLESMLSDWMTAAVTFETRDDPTTALTKYIQAKMDLSRRRPYGSQVWAKEIMSGAPVMEQFLATTLKRWTDERIGIIEKWIDERRMNKVDASAFLYMIWATTQHYADFDRQITLLNSGKALSDAEFEQKKIQVTQLILGSVGLIQPD